ncbi:hypothetical protein ABIC44_002696 [Sphingomonas sp. 1185]
MHRLGRHPLDDADAGDDDALRAHLLQQPVEEMASVGEWHCGLSEPGHQIGSDRAAEITESEACLDRGELVVAGGRAPREVSDGVRLHADLFGDMVEHDRRQQFARAQMAAGIAQAAQLQRIAEPGGRCPRGADRVQIAGVEAVVSHHHCLGVG